MTNLVSGELPSSQLTDKCFSDTLRKDIGPTRPAPRCFGAIQEGYVPMLLEQRTILCPVTRDNLRTACMMATILKILKSL